MRGDVEFCVSQHEKMRRKLARRDPVCDFHTEADERVLLAVRDPGRGISTALRQSIQGRHLAFSQLRHRAREHSHCTRSTATSV